MIASEADRVAVEAQLALVIDDDAALRQFIGAALTQLGMKVASFDMAKGALASLDYPPPGGHPPRRCVSRSILANLPRRSCNSDCIGSCSTSIPGCSEQDWNLSSNPIQQHRCGNSRRPPATLVRNRASGHTLALEQRTQKTKPRRLHQSPKQKEPTVMGLFSKDIKTMNDLFVHTLQDIYYAEKQIVKALPDMIEKASDPQLKQGFQSHLRETENHVKRLEQVFKLLGKQAKGVDCPAIDGIIEEANDIAGEVEQKSVLDAALIAAAQAVEHYEMTRYGTLIAWANQLGQRDCVTLLQQTLDEEKATDKKLTAMAESQVNRKAAA
jgi:ferritin-like metal-binding protein YciE